MRGRPGGFIAGASRQNPKSPHHSACSSGPRAWPGIWPLGASLALTSESGVEIGPSEILRGLWDPSYREPTATGRGAQSSVVVPPHYGSRRRFPKYIG